MTSSGPLVAEASTAPATNNNLTASFRVATFNILGAGEPWSGTQNSFRFWENRLPDIERILKEENFDLIGFQELFTGRIESSAVREILGPGYKSTPMDSFKKRKNAIFYRSSLFRMMEHGFLELTKVDGNRHALWVLFEHIPSKQRFYMYNTHISHTSAEARKISSEIIARDMETRNKQNLPIIMTGDFNTDGAGKGKPTTIFAGVGLRDARDIIAARPVSITNTTLQDNTFHSMRPTLRRQGIHIDKIYVSDRVAVQSYHVLVEPDVSRRPSDHFPVVASVRLRR